MTGVHGAWDRFWFAPAPTTTLAVVRIAYGLVLLGWSCSLAPDAVDFFSSSGLLEQRPSQAWTWSLLDMSSSPWTVTALLAVLVAAAASLVLGFHTRLASVAAFVVLLSFERQNPFVDNGGDQLLRLLGFYLMLAPAGAALSLDRWRAGAGDWWSCPEHAPWALRLMQVQMSLVYLFGVWEKVQGTTWNDGTAISYAWRVQELTRFSLPHWLTDSLLLVNVLTYSTLAIEAALAALVWNRRARPWVLTGGVALHLSIETTMVVGFFSFVVLVGYVAFVPPETMNRVVGALRIGLANLVGEIRKGSPARVLTPLTPTPRTQGGSPMHTVRHDPHTMRPSPAVRSFPIATVAVVIALAALVLGSSPASASPPAPSGPGHFQACVALPCPTDDPTGDPTGDLKPTGGGPTDDPTGDPTGDFKPTGGDPTDDPTGDPTGDFKPTGGDPTGDPTGDFKPTGGDPTGQGDGTGGGDGTGRGSSGDGGRKIVVPTRIDTGAGGSATKPGGTTVALIVAATLGAVGITARHSAARRSAASVPSPERG